MPKLLLSLALLATLGNAQDSLAPAAPVPAHDPARTVLVFVSTGLYGEDALAGLRSGLAAGGFDVRTAGRDTGLCVGMDMTVLRPDFALADCRPDDFAALALADGAGITLLWSDSLLHQTCRAFVAAGRPVASVGIANIVLARAGLLKGRKATVLPDKNAVAELKAGGARYLPNPVVSDGPVLTAADSEQSRALGAALGRRLAAR